MAERTEAAWTRLTGLPDRPEAGQAVSALIGPRVERRQEVGPFGTTRRWRASKG